MTLYYYISFRYFTKNLRRSLLTILGISVGISLFTAIRMINRSTLESYQKNIETVAGKSTLVVTAGDLGFPEQRLEVLDHFPGIEAAAPVVLQQIYYTQTDGTVQPFFVFGIDLLRESAVRQHQQFQEKMIEDPLEFLNQADSIILTDAFAKQNHLSVGSEFELTSIEGIKKFTVRGILANTGLANAYQGRVAVMDVDAAQVTFGKVGKLDRIDLIVNEKIQKNEEALNELIHKIESQLGEGYLVQRPEMQGQGLSKMIDSFQVVLSLFSTLALLVGMVLVFNTVSISVTERKREIGTLRALGAKSMMILLLILFESFIMSFFGTLLGVVSATFLARFLSHRVAMSISVQYLIPVEIHKIQLSNGDLNLALFVGICCSVIAALIPALKATRIYPLEAIKSQDLLQTQESKSFSTSLCLLVGTASFFYVVFSNYFSFGSYFHILRFVEVGATFATAAFYAPVIVYFGTRCIVRLKGNRLPFIVRLAFENLYRNFNRTNANVISLMVGLLLLVFISSMTFSFKSTFKSWADEAFPWDLFVSTQGNFFQFQSQPLDEKFSNDLVQIPGLTLNRFGKVTGLRYLKTQFEDKTIAIKAYDLPYEQLQFAQFSTIDQKRTEVGPLLFDLSQTNIMVSENFVKHFHKKTGDTIDLNTPNGKLRAHIISVMRDFASNQGVIYISREWVKRYWNDQLVNSFTLKANDGHSIELLQQEILTRYGKKYHLAITPTQTIKETIQKTLDQSLAYTEVIELASLITAILSIFNTTMVSILERKREFARLKAVGMSPWQTFLLILYESFGQGLLGSVASIVIGFVLSYFWVTYTLAELLGWIIVYSISKQTVFLCGATGFLATFCAGVWPAWRASQIRPGGKED